MLFMNSLSKWKILILSCIIGCLLVFVPQAVNARPTLRGLQGQINVIKTQIEVLEAEFGVNWMGTWDSGTPYEQKDAVSYDGSSYIATDTSLGEVPPSGNWDLLAQKGEDGEQGIQGEKGGGGAIAGDEIHSGTEWNSKYWV